MRDFYDDIPETSAQRMRELTRLVYELRASRNQILSLQAVDSEQELLQRLSDGIVDEHPAYEQYLSACILEQTRSLAREEIQHWLVDLGEAS